MNQSTNTTASIDLAQLDKLRTEFEELIQGSANLARDEHGGYLAMATALKFQGFALARRSLTSGAPAVGEVVMHEGEKIIDGSMAFMDAAPVGTQLYAGPVHDAAAPSDVQRCKDCGRTGWHVCRYSAGAAAKTEQAPCDNCDGKGGWKTDEWIDPVSGPECTVERCEVCMGSGIEPATAAGAGSAQPRAEEDERMLPPLPEPWGTMYSDSLQEKDGFTADQMRGYAIDYSRAALDQGAQAATTASASDQKPCGWLAGNSHDGGETMYCRREDAQRECDEYNTFERSQPDFDPESLRTPKPVYLAALARAPLPAQGCRWPTCESEKVQQEVADQAYRELYSGEQAQSVDDARDAARREAWLIANHRWSVRWRIHTKKQIEQWQMVDDGEPWGQWGNYRKVIDAAMRANDGAAEGGSQK